MGEVVEWIHSGVQRRRIWKKNDITRSGQTEKWSQGDRVQVQYNVKADTVWMFPCLWNGGRPKFFLQSSPSPSKVDSLFIKSRWWMANHLFPKTPLESPTFATQSWPSSRIAKINVVPAKVFLSSQKFMLMIMMTSNGGCLLCSNNEVCITA